MILFLCTLGRGGFSIRFRSFDLSPRNQVFVGEVLKLKIKEPLKKKVVRLYHPVSYHAS